MENLPQSIQRDIKIEMETQAKLVKELTKIFGLVGVG